MKRVFCHHITGCFSEFVVLLETCAPPFKCTNIDFVSVSARSTYEAQRLAIENLEKSRFLYVKPVAQAFYLNA